VGKGAAGVHAEGRGGMKRNPPRFPWLCASLVAIATLAVGHPRGAGALIVPPEPAVGSPLTP
jgi:hypothetical protein